MLAIKDKEAFHDFAQNRVYWYGKSRTSVDYYNVLQTILARKTPMFEAEARQRFGVTDDDFREALKRTPPGMFPRREKWELVNRRFGFDPPLPYPQWNLEQKRAELHELERNK